MLQKEREAKLRARERGNVQLIVLMMAIIVVFGGIIIYGIIQQHDSQRGIDNACFNTDPMYGCSPNHPL